MENKTSYSLQDAREEVAKEMQGKEFWACPINFKRDIELSNSAYKYYTDSAELYKSKATEELRKAIVSLRELNQTLMNDIIAYKTEIEELRKENEVLRSMNEKYSEGVDNLTVFINILKEDSERLKESNKELFDNLARVIDRIEEQELQGNFPSAYKRAKEALQKSKP